MKALTVTARVMDRQEVKRLGTSESKPHLLQAIKKRKLSFYGHISRKEGSCCMEKEIIQGTTPGQRRRGRPKTNWHDNIMEWTRLKGHCLLKAAEDRRQWRKIVLEVVNPRIKDH